MHDPLMTPDYIRREILHKVPGARMALLDCGHNLPLELPMDLGFQGIPSSIDVLRVTQTGIAPLINTGVASRQTGVGQIGAGMQSLPLACFVEASEAMLAISELR